MPDHKTSAQESKGSTAAQEARSSIYDPKFQEAKNQKYDKQIQQLDQKTQSQNPKILIKDNNSNEFCEFTLANQALKQYLIPQSTRETNKIKNDNLDMPRQNDQYSIGYDFKSHQRQYFVAQLNQQKPDNLPLQQQQNTTKNQKISNFSHFFINSLDGADQSPQNYNPAKEQDFLAIKELKNQEFQNKISEPASEKGSLKHELSLKQELFQDLIEQLKQQGELKAKPEVQGKREFGERPTLDENEKWNQQKISVFNRENKSCGETQEQRKFNYQIQNNKKLSQQIKNHLEKKRDSLEQKQPKQFTKSLSSGKLSCQSNLKKGLQQPQSSRNQYFKQQFQISEEKYKSSSTHLRAAQPLMKLGPKEGLISNKYNFLNNQKSLHLQPSSKAIVFEKLNTDAFEPPQPNFNNCNQLFMERNSIKNPSIQDASFQPKQCFLQLSQYQNTKNEKPKNLKMFDNYINSVHGQTKVASSKEASNFNSHGFNKSTYNVGDYNQNDLQNSTKKTLNFSYINQTYLEPPKIFFPENSDQLEKIQQTNPEKATYSETEQPRLFHADKGPQQTFDRGSHSIFEKSQPNFPKATPESLQNSARLRENIQNYQQKQIAKAQNHKSQKQPFSSFRSKNNLSREIIAQPLVEQDFNMISLNDLGILERNKLWLQEKFKKQMKVKQEKEECEIKECTFKPNLQKSKSPIQKMKPQGFNKMIIYNPYESGNQEKLSRKLSFNDCKENKNLTQSSYNEKFKKKKNIQTAGLNQNN